MRAVQKLCQPFLQARSIRYVTTIAQFDKIAGLLKDAELPILSQSHSSIHADSGTTHHHHSAGSVMSDPNLWSNMVDDTKKLYAGIESGDRVALARAITLIESSRADHRKQAELLLDALLTRRAGLSKHRKHIHTSLKPTYRIGIAGPPGAGKSTLIEALGMHAVSLGHRVAVVAVDPSSSRFGGSILGDKTRMVELSRSPNAFVRPSPTRGALGGVAQHTNDVVLLCEGAGYDIVIVESVGLGQSEVVIDSTVDCLVLVVPPAGGDELQGVKKGIVEVADLIVVNKCDGELEKAAGLAATEYRRALQLIRWKHSQWQPRVLRCSALHKTSIVEVWDTAKEFHSVLETHGILQQRRREQSCEWMWHQLESQLMLLARADVGVVRQSERLKEVLGEGHVTPRRAAHELLRTFMQSIATTAKAMSTEASAESATNTNTSGAVIEPKSVGT